MSASLGKAYRFATPSELYQLVSTGTTLTSPDPNLKPDNVMASKLRIGRTFSSGMTQVALFQDDVHEAIISQFLPLVANSTTFLLSTGSAPGIPKQTGQTFEFGGAPNRVEHEQKILVAVNS